jgi:hypothetical protein
MVPVDPENVAFPAKVAMIFSVPTGRAEVVRTALPVPSVVAEPRVWAVFVPVTYWNWTLSPAVAELTVAVRVTEVPCGAVPTGEAVRVVVVAVGAEPG